MRLVRVALALVCVCATTNLTAAPPVLTCGQTLGPGGEYKLTVDLNCNSNGLTVADGAILNLNGHTVYAQRAGVTLSGHGSIVRNGNVAGEFGVLLLGAVHTVKNIHVVTAGIGIMDASKHSQIINNTIDERSTGAIVMNEPIAIHNNVGTGAVISGNTIVCGARCVSIFGAMAEVSGNTISCAPQAVGPCATAIVVADFFAPSVGNILTKNVITGFQVAIEVRSEQNLIDKNDVHDNQIGLRDTHGDCSLNTWRNNTFQVAEPACIE